MAGYDDRDGKIWLDGQLVDSELVGGDQSASLDLKIETVFRSPQVGSATNRPVSSKQSA